MKNFGLTGLKRFLVTAVLGIGLVLLSTPGAIATPFPFSQTLIAQAAAAKPSQSPQPPRSPSLTEEVENTVQPKQPTTEQRPTQSDQQRSTKETTSPRERNQGDRSSTPTPYDPYDMGAIRQFDKSWYGQ